MDYTRKGGAGRRLNRPHTITAALIAVQLNKGGYVSVVQYVPDSHGINNRMYCKG
jgi:hypothetical protein